MLGAEGWSDMTRIKKVGHGAKTTHYACRSDRSGPSHERGEEGSECMWGRSTGPIPGGLQQFTKDKSEITNPVR